MVPGLALLPTQVLKLFPEHQPRPSHSPVPHPLHVPAQAPLVIAQHSKSVHGADLAEINLAHPPKYVLSASSVPLVGSPCSHKSTSNGGRNGVGLRLAGARYMTTLTQFTLLCRCFLQLALLWSFNKSVPPHCPCRTLCH